MAIVVSCKSCGRRLSVKDEFAGKRGKCPGCGKVIALPAVPESPPFQTSPARWPIYVGAGAVLLCAVICVFIIVSSSRRPSTDVSIALEPVTPETADEVDEVETEEIAADEPVFPEEESAPPDDERTTARSIRRRGIASTEPERELVPDELPDRPDERLFAERSVMPAAWRIYPPQSRDQMLIVMGKGEISDYPAYIRNYERVKTPSWDRAAQIVGDPIFMMSRGEHDYNLWAMLELVESVYRDQGEQTVAHFIIQPDNNIADIQRKYGEADHIGKYSHYYTPRGETERRHGVIEVHWYGVIFFIVEANGAIGSIGGWPSRL